VYTWYSSFLAWSPGGRYLIAPVSLRGLVHPVGEPIPPADELNAVIGSLTPPTMPIRDTAQQQLYVLLTKIAAGGDKLFCSVAWNPTGRILAAFPDGGASDATNGGASAVPVALYDSATGRSLGMLQPAAHAHASANGSSASSDINVNSLLRWSADGLHLLAYSDQSGIITIWSPSLLPHSLR
jgi:WD40 repeat protein